jgi:hypothetical protein
VYGSLEYYKCIDEQQNRELACVGVSQDTTSPYASKVAQGGGTATPQTETVIVGYRYSGGLLQMMTGALGSVYRQPAASGTYYVADAMSNMGLAPKTYAQGFGYYGLTPYLQVWRVFRNVTYLAFTVVIMVVAMLILFRQKVGNQAALTAQQALPRIVISLILVTFSYAIVGFLIDLMYWIMYLFASFFSLKGGGLGSAANVPTIGFGELIKAFTTGTFSNGWDAISELTSSILDSLPSGAVFVAMMASGQGFVTSFVTTALTAVSPRFASWTSGALGSMIITITIFVGLFRLLFILLKSYAAVLLYLIFSPFFLMMYAIPGTNSFFNWVKKVIANLSPFVVVFFMVLIVGVINHYMGGSSGTTVDASITPTTNPTPTTETTWISPLTVSAADTGGGTGGWVPPFLTNNPSSRSLGTLIALAMLLALPEIVNSVKEKLGGGAGWFELMATKGYENARGGIGAKMVGGVAKWGAGKAGGAMAGGAMAGLRSLGNRRTARRAGDEKYNSNLAASNEELARRDEEIALQDSNVKDLETPANKSKRLRMLADGHKLKIAESVDSMDDSSREIKRYRKHLGLGSNVSLDVVKDKLKQSMLKSKMANEMILYNKNVQAQKQKSAELRNARQSYENEKEARARSAAETERQQTLERISRGDTLHFLGTGFFKGAGNVASEWFNDTYPVRYVKAFDKFREMKERDEATLDAYTRYNPHADAAERKKAMDYLMFHQTFQAAMLNNPQWANPT